MNLTADQQAKFREAARILAVSSKECEARAQLEGWERTIDLIDMAGEMPSTPMEPWMLRAEEAAVLSLFD